MQIERLNAMRRGLLIVCMLILCWGLGAQGAIVNVPGDQPTIQAGIDAAAVGDTVLVAAGVYTENIRFNGKEAMLKSADGSAATTIEPLDPMVSIVSFIDGEGRGAVIEGFGLTGTVNAPAVTCNNSSPIIRTCEIMNCRAQFSAGAIRSTYGSPWVMENIIHTNSLEEYAVQIIAPGVDSVVIKDNVAHNNVGGAVLVSNSTVPVYVMANVIFDNDGGIAVTGSGTGGQILRNVVYGNLSMPGIAVAGMDGIEVSNNTSYGNETGIAVDWAQGSAYGGYNVIANNIGVGLYDGAHRLSHNLVWGNGTPFANPPHPPNTFIAADPEFADPSAGDFSLTCESPAIDAGDPAMTDPDGSIADMGAITFDHTIREVCDTILIPGLPPMIICYIDSTLPAAMNLSVDNEPALKLSSVSPVFSWEPVTGGTQLAFECEVVRLDSTGTTVIFGSGEVVSATASFSYSGPPLEAGLSYVFRLRLRDYRGWSCWRSIVIRRNAAPNKAWPQKPADGARVREGEVDLQVRPESDPEGDLVSYRFEVYADESMSQLAGSAEVIATIPGNVHSGIIGGLATGSTYWWRCRTFDFSDSSVWGSTRSFLVASAGIIHVPGDFGEIAAAVNYAINGDTIDIAAGVYEISSSVFVIGKGICIQGSQTEEGTVIRKTDAAAAFYVSSPANSWTEFRSLEFEVRSSISASGELRLRNCVFRRVLSANEPMVRLVDDVLVEDCKFVELDLYAYNLDATLGGGESITIVRNEFLDASPMEGAPAILLFNTGNLACSLSISGNLIHQEGALSGIRLDGGPFTGTISNNVIDKALIGIAIDDTSSELRIANNIITSCIQTAFLNAALADFNDLWNNNTDYSNTPPGAHDLHIDPQYVDAANGDYRLLCTSPCIDAGDPASSATCSGKRIDIGAFEFEYVVGNANGNTSGNLINLTDAVFLVNHIFAGGPAPCPIGAGQVDCDDQVTISDVVYLVNYLYAQGPAPCSGC